MVRIAGGNSRAFALALGCIVWLGGCADVPGPPERVIVVVIDTLRADRLGLYGRGGEDPMPRLTALAERGSVFDRTWAPSSWTAPSTASLFTGVYPEQHGVEIGVWLYGTQREANPTLRLHRIPAELETLPELFRSQGYRTFGVADNVNIGPREGFDSGFDRFESFDYAGAKRVNAVLESWREEMAAHPKRFVYLHYMDPHEPYHLRKKFAKPVAGAAGPKADVLVRYDSELRFLDAELARGLELAGFDDQTTLVVAADHGEAFYDRGDAVGHGFQLYSELVRVPFFVVDPQRRGPARVGANTSLVDLVPTVREWLGLPVDETLAGRSLVPLYTGSGSPVPGDRVILSSRRHLAKRGGGVKRSVVKGSLKSIETRAPSGARVSRELYDLSVDPGETRNLALSRARELAELQAEWDAFHEQAPRFGPEEADPYELSPEEVERLEALGYAEEGSR